MHVQDLRTQESATLILRVSTVYPESTLVPILADRVLRRVRDLTSSECLVVLAAMKKLEASESFNPQVLQASVVEEMLSRGTDLVNREVAGFSELFQDMDKEIIMNNLEGWKNILNSRTSLNTGQLRKVTQAMRTVPELTQHHRTILTKMAKLAKDRISSRNMPKNQIIGLAMMVDVYGSVKLFPRVAVQKVNAVAEEGLCNQPELIRVFNRTVEHAYKGACDKELDRLAKNIIGEFFSCNF